MFYVCSVLQRWDTSVQTGHKEAAPARDASQCQDQRPDNATPLSCKSYFLNFHFLSRRFFLFFSNLLNSNFLHADRQLGPDSPEESHFIIITFSELVSEYYISFPFACFHIKAGVNERRDLHTTSLLLLLLLLFQGPPPILPSPPPTHSIPTLSPEL